MNKIVLYAGSGTVVLIAVFVVLLLVIPVTPEINVQINDYDDNHTLAHEAWIEWYRNADEAELGHVHNIIARDTWVAQYEFEQEFHPEDELVVEYLSALVVQKEILQGIYNPVEDEKLIRYHEWLLKTFDVPPTLEGVEQAMLDLVGGNPDNLHRIDHVHYHNNRATMFAEPPFDLWESDPDWWALQNQLSFCQYDDIVDCDDFIWAYENTRPLTDEELELMQSDFDESVRQWRAEKEAEQNDSNTASAQSWDFFLKQKHSYV